MLEYWNCYISYKSYVAYQKLTLHLHPSTKYLSLFILFVAYILNAASYDGEILRAHVCQPCAGHVLGFMSIGVVVTKVMDIFPKMRAYRPRLLLW